MFESVMKSKLFYPLRALSNAHPPGKRSRWPGTSQYRFCGQSLVTRLKAFCVTRARVVFLNITSGGGEKVKGCRAEWECCAPALSMCVRDEVGCYARWRGVRLPKMVCSRLVSLINWRIRGKALGVESKKLMLCACRRNLSSNLDRATL